MSDPTPPATPEQHPLSDFAEQSARLDRDLDDALHHLRVQLGYDRINPREAADLRIGLLTEHLAKIHDLRVKHFGEGDPATGWISGTSGAS